MKWFLFVFVATNLGWHPGPFLPAGDFDSLAECQAAARALIETSQHQLDAGCGDRYGYGPSQQFLVGPRN